MTDKGEEIPKKKESLAEILERLRQKNKPSPRDFYNDDDLKTEDERDPAKMLAKELAARERQLVEQIQKLIKDKGANGKTYISDSESYIFCSETGFNLHTRTDNLKGFGMGGVDLFYSPGNSEQLTNTVGVETNVILGIGVNTEGLDEKLKEFEQGYSWYAYAAVLSGTQMLFSEQGDSVKLTLLPLEFEDPRPVIETFDPIKKVKTEITPGDFELAAGALAILEKAVNGIKTGPTTVRPR